MEKFETLRVGLEHENLWDSYEELKYKYNKLLSSIRLFEI